jgi:hypothetical protein
VPVFPMSPIIGSGGFDLNFRRFFANCTPFPYGLP